MLAFSFSLCTIVILKNHLFQEVSQQLLWSIILFFPQLLHLLLAHIKLTDVQHEIKRLHLVLVMSSW